MPDEDEAEAEQPTAAGEGDATAIVLAPTQAAPELAWSAADEEDDIVDVDALITPATDPAPGVEVTPPRSPRRTARRTPSPKL